MRAVVHQTPGLIPTESFMVFGLHAKPNSDNPIGHFGTGLKMALAVLVRNKLKVTLFIGQTEYVFYTKEEQFRGKTFDYIRMKKRKGLLARWSYETLPFTTELAKNWEVWQAYRELHANTLDEKGTTYMVDGVTSISTNPTVTFFLIEGESYVHAYLERDKIFLPDGLTQRNEGDPAIQVLERPSNHIYYRGMRIMDLNKQAQFTYNFVKPVTLTEDRTAKYPWMLESEIVDMIVESQDESFVRKVVPIGHSPGVPSFESALPYASYSGGTWGTGKPSEPFLEVAKKSSHHSVKDVWDKQQPTVATEVRLTLTLPKPSITELEFEALQNAIAAVFPTAVLHQPPTASQMAEKEIMF